MSWRISSYRIRVRRLRPSCLRVRTVFLSFKFCSLFLSFAPAATPLVQLVAGIAAGRRPALSALLPPDWRSVISKSWSQSPEDRPSAGELLQQLRLMFPLAPKSSMAPTVPAALAEGLAAMKLEPGSASVAGSGTRERPQAAPPVLPSAPHAPASALSPPRDCKPALANPPSPVAALSAAPASSPSLDTVPAKEPSEAAADAAATSQSAPVSSIPPGPATASPPSPATSSAKPKTPAVQEASNAPGSPVPPTSGPSGRHYGLPAEALDSASANATAPPSTPTTPPPVFSFSAGAAIPKASSSAWGVQSVHLFPAGNVSAYPADLPSSLMHLLVVA